MKYHATINSSDGLRDSISGGSMTLKQSHLQPCKRCARDWYPLRSSSSQSAASLARAPTHNDPATTIPRTPIKHVIVIIGENRSFDHVFATYVPKNGQNGLESAFRRNREGRRNARPEFSQGGAAGSHRSGARRFPAEPAKAPFPNNVLPAPLVGGPDRLLCDERQPDACAAVRKRASRGLLSVSGVRRHRPDVARLPTRASRT